MLLLFHCIQQFMLAGNQQQPVTTTDKEIFLFTTPNNNLDLITIY